MTGLDLLESRRDAAIAALDRQDYAQAIAQAMAAKLILSTLPNATRGVGSGSQSLAWNAQAIDSFIDQVRSLQSAAAVSAGGIRQTRVTYARTTPTEAYE